LENVGKRTTLSRRSAAGFANILNCKNRSKRQHIEVRFIRIGGADSPSKKPTFSNILQHSPTFSREWEDLLSQARERLAGPERSWPVVHVLERHRQFRPSRLALEPVFAADDHIGSFKILERPIKS
jgi:hypothetical protein